MARVDSEFAAWLQADADKAVRTDAATAARWGAGAIATEQLTGIATRADAEAEAERQLAFHARGPFAIDEHSVTGDDWVGLLGRVITLATPALGYAGGVDVLLIGVAPGRAPGLTALTVVRPLRSLS